MPDTPTVWLDRHQVNATDAGEQSGPDVIGLANGNYLVVWTEEGDAIGTTPGKDIVGQLFDPEGTRIGDEVRLNGSSITHDEQDASIAAMPDGGFVIVYEDFSTFDIYRERYDANLSIVNESLPTNRVSVLSDTQLYQNASVAARDVGDQWDGEQLIAYEHYNPNDGTNDIAVKIFAATGTTTQAQFSRYDSTGFAFNPDVDVLTNGSYVVVFEDDPAGNLVGDADARFIIAGRTSGFQFGAGQMDQSTNFITDVHVAALTNGGFVAVWTEDFGGATSVEVRFRIYDNAGNPQGVTDTVPVSANTSPGGIQRGGDVVALADGGFVVVWEDDVTGEIDGQRFDADGSLVGNTFVAGNFGDESNGVQALLADGRFVTVFEESSSDTDVHATIFDPRTSPISGTDNSEVTTSTRDGAMVSGLAGNDTLLGEEGSDTLAGGAGNDGLFGRDGQDSLFGGSGSDRLYGGDSTDRLYGSSGSDRLYGEDGGDKLYSGSSNDRLYGGDGNDFLDGSSGKDRLYGDAGKDRLDGGPQRDILKGGSGHDYFDFNGLSDSKRGGQRDKIVDFSRSQHDDIDLKSIDAKKGVSGNQKFKWIGKQDFHDDKGELRYEDKGSKVIVQGDTNGDGKADFEVYVMIGSLHKGDFIL